MNNGFEKFDETYSGKEAKLGAARELRRPADEKRQFTKFTQEQYDSMYASIVDGTLAIDDSFDADVKPAVNAITVNYHSFDKALKTCFFNRPAHPAQGGFCSVSPILGYFLCSFYCTWRDFSV